MFNIVRLLKSVQMSTTRERKSLATSNCPRLPCIPTAAGKRLFIRFLRHGRPKVIFLILFFFFFGFTKTVAVSLNEAGPFALRNSIMGDRGSGGGGEGTPIHYLYGYVPPNGVVILKLLI